MKALKKISALVLFVFILTGIGLGLLFTPGIQKKIFLKLLEQPGIEISIENFKFGWKRLEIKRFHFSQNGTDIKFDKLKVELLAISIIFDDAIELNNFTLTDLTVILPGQSPQMKASINPPEVKSSLELGSKLETGYLEGDFILKRMQGNYELFASQPIQLKNTSLTHQGRSLIKDIEIITLPHVTFNSNAVESLFNEINLSSDGLLLLTGQCRISATANEKGSFVTTRGSFNGHLSHWLEQPILHNFGNIREGRFSLEGEMELNQPWTTHLNLHIQDLELYDRSHRISNAELDLTGHLNYDGTIDIKAPFIVEGSNGKSDGDLQLSCQRLENGLVVNASLSGKQLYLRDFIFLKGIYSSGNPSLSERPVSPMPLLVKHNSTPASFHFIQHPLNPIQPSLEPFWTNYTGRAFIHYKKINLNRDSHLDNISSEIHLNSDNIKIENFEARINESPITLTGELKFTSAILEPYSLEARAQLPRFDTGAYLKRIEPNSKPIVEAVVDIKSDIRANGRNINELWNKAQGQININSNGGIFRALVAAGDNASSGADLLNIVGSLLGDKVRELRTTSRLANFLRKIEFDSFKTEAIRDKNLDIHLTQFLVKSRDIHLSGRGRVSYQEGVPILDQPVDLKTQFSAKNDVATLLQELTLLKNKEDELGYKLGPSFSIHGSLSRPDFSDLNRIIFQASKGLLFRENPQSN